jgi:hypothetical protein
MLTQQLPYFQTLPTSFLIIRQPSMQSLCLYYQNATNSLLFKRLWPPGFRGWGVDCENRIVNSARLAIRLSPFFPLDGFPLLIAFGSRNDLGESSIRWVIALIVGERDLSRAANASFKIRI